MRMNKNTLFIEETTQEGYNILWKDGTAQEAMSFLKSCQSKNRLELWSKAHVETEKGFCPMAYRNANSNKVMVSNTFKMFFLDSTH